MYYARLARTSSDNRTQIASCVYDTIAGSRARSRSHVHVPRSVTVTAELFEIKGVACLLCESAFFYIVEKYVKI